MGGTCTYAATGTFQYLTISLSVGCCIVLDRGLGVGWANRLPTHGCNGLQYVAGGACYVGARATTGCNPIRRARLGATGRSALLLGSAGMAAFRERTLGKYRDSPLHPIDVLACYRLGLRIRSESVRAGILAFRAGGRRRDLLALQGRPSAMGEHVEELHGRGSKAKSGAELHGLSHRAGPPVCHRSHRPRRLYKPALSVRVG